LRKVESPKLPFVFAYSSLPIRIIVRSSSRTTAASTFSRGRSGRAKSRSIRARILGSTRANRRMRLYFTSSRTERKRV